jgi:hypothetical protein
VIAPSRSEMVKRAAVARFLEREICDVDRMIEEDGLPHQRFPGKERPSIRIFLPDFHAWTLRHSRGEIEAVADYPTFKAAFMAAQPVPKKRTRKKKSETQPSTSEV